MTRDTHCRRCGSADVRRSSEHGILDLVMHGIFKRRPYRCRSCRARFFAAADLLAPEQVDIVASPGEPRTQGSSPSR